MKTIPRLLLGFGFTACLGLAPQAVGAESLPLSSLDLQGMAANACRETTWWLAHGAAEVVVCRLAEARPAWHGPSPEQRRQRAMALRERYVDEALGAAVLAMPDGTTPSPWRVYVNHGELGCKLTWTVESGEPEAFDVCTQRRYNADGLPKVEGAAPLAVPPHVIDGDTLLLGRLPDPTASATPPLPSVDFADPALSPVQQLVRAARWGNLARVRELLASGVDVNARAPDGSVALMAAVERRQEAMVALLLERGAEVGVAYSGNLGGVELARIMEAPAIEAMLIRAGAHGPMPPLKTPRADLLKLSVAAIPLTEKLAREWQPLVDAYGAKVLSDWERGLYEAAVGRHDMARRWLLKAAAKGDIPEKNALCLAYKLARGTEPEDRDDLVANLRAREAAEQKLLDWVRSAVAKRDKKQTLSTEEKAALAAFSSLPDDEAGERLAHQRLVICRTLTDIPAPEKLFRAALAAGRPLPAYAFNYLGTLAESHDNRTEANRYYAQAEQAGFAPARTNQLRLRERHAAAPVDDLAWAEWARDYRAQADKGDGIAAILLADLLERGHGQERPDPEAAIRLYRQGLDAGADSRVFNQGMGYVFLALHAQERLTSYFQEHWLKLGSEAEKKKYLSMGYHLDAAREKWKAP